MGWVGAFDGVALAIFSGNRREKTKIVSLEITTWVSVTVDYILCR